MSDIRTRIAPSPTGFLHIGTARTALFNYLFAKRYGGTFVMRIEDTDLERSDAKFEADIFAGLKWLGIEADESPEIGGSYGPYRQSERTEDYTKAIQQLLNEGKAFYCFHSEQELEKEKDDLMEAKKPILHVCEYRMLEPKEAEALTRTKSTFIIRFKTPAGETVSFDDLIRGTLSFESDLIGDFSIAKRVDVPLYNFAVVVDDEAMKISHVIRGEDHIANTPKQILLTQALGYAMPIYAHLPLILGQDRSKLSKRHGATSVIEYKELGYLPEALFNFMGLLGWNPGTEREVFSRQDLANEFSIEKVQKSGAIFDLVKLDWMNGEYIRTAQVGELARLCMPYFIKNNFVEDNTVTEKIEKIVALEQPRLKKLSDIADSVEYFFKEPVYDRELLKWKTMTDEALVESLDFSISLLEEHTSKDIAEIQKIFLEKATERGDRGSVLWPLRVALTGRKNSPGPFEVMGIIGTEVALARLKAAKRM